MNFFPLRTDYRDCSNIRIYKSIIISNNIINLIIVLDMVTKGDKYVTIAYEQGGSWRYFATKWRSILY